VKERRGKRVLMRRVVEKFVKWSHFFHPVVMGVSAKEEK
jgi:hypothetical protein